MNNNSDNSINGVNNLNNNSMSSTPTVSPTQPQTNNSVSVIDNSSNSANNSYNQIIIQNDNSSITQQITEDTALQMSPNKQLTNNLNIASQQNNTSINDEELLKAFIGKNYEKIMTKRFNFASYFFTIHYMFYRKMFLYTIPIYALGLTIGSFKIPPGVINTIYSFFTLASGFLFNKVYLHSAKRKIAKIKLKNPHKDIEELKVICSKKGGASVRKLILGFIIEIIIIVVGAAIIIMSRTGGGIKSAFDLNNWKELLDIEDIDESTSQNDTILVEDVKVDSYACIDSKCNVYIEKEDKKTKYSLDVSNTELFKTLSNYDDYVKLNIYYIQKDKSIIKYEILLKSNNENVSNVKSEDELRTKIGLYNEGIHTDTFELVEKGTPSFDWKDEIIYSYIDYKLLDNKNNKYVMQYIITDKTSDNSTNLFEDSKYNVTFEVTKETSGYKYYIKDIK